MNVNDKQALIPSLIQQHLPALTRLRRYLHQHPELSGKEINTAAYLQEFLQQYQPTNILTSLGSGTGLAAIWDSGVEGPHIFFRAELDALPIQEENQFSYNSATTGISHKCGHDGHMTMVAALAITLQNHLPAKGKVGLLFQPAEETGQGALSIVKDKRFLALRPDFIIGLHNLPGYELGEVVLRNGTFSAASTGMRIILNGRTAHAAEPEKAVSPAACMMHLLQTIPGTTQTISLKHPALITVTHARLGEANFGISPGQAIIHFTLRSYDNNDMELMIAEVENLIKNEAAKHTLEVTIEYEETFPLTANNDNLVQVLKHAANNCGLPVNWKKEPFPWSEDFGHYAAITQTLFFGLGAGLEQHNLHHPSYDFPDNLLPFGIKIYQEIIPLLMEKQAADHE